MKKMFAFMSVIAVLIMATGFVGSSSHTNVGSAAPICFEWQKYDAQISTMLKTQGIVQSTPEFKNLVSKRNDAYKIYLEEGSKTEGFVPLGKSPWATYCVCPICDNQWIYIHCSFSLENCANLFCPHCNFVGPMNTAHGPCEPW